MGSANMKCFFKEVKYPPNQPGDPGCTVWGGVINFTASNGSYIGNHTFINLVVYPGQTTPVNELFYNAIGGYCGAGTAQLTFQVSVSGTDSAGNHVTGSNTVTVNRPPTPPRQQVSINYSVPVTVTNSGTGQAATKWFVFTVITMC